MNKHFHSAFAVVIFSSMLAACGGGGGSSTTPSPPPVVFTPISGGGCATASSDYVVTLGDYQLSTNAWGKGTLTNFTDCIEGKTVGTVVNNIAIQTGVTAKFTWSWPTAANDVNSTKDFTEILYSPGGTRMKSIAFSDIGNLTMHHDITIVNSGFDQTFYDIWADPTPEVNWPHAVEIIIFAQSIYHNVQDRIDTVSIAGNQYYVTYSNSIKSWMQPPGWTMIVFESVVPNLKADVPLKPFIDYMVAKSLLPKDYYISTLEFGDEQNYGDGTLTVNSYNITR